MSQVVRVTFHSSGGTLAIANTFHYALHNTGIQFGQADVDEVLSTLATHLVTPYRGMLNTGMTLDRIDAVTEELSTGGAIPVVATHPVGLAGTRTTSDDRLPWSMSALVALRSNAAVRGGVGRFWAPPPIVSSSLGAGHTWDHTALYWLSVRDFCNALMDTVRAGGGWAGTSHDYGAVVYSRTRRDRGDAAYYFDIIGYTIRDVPHWLRSRAT